MSGLVKVDIATEVNSDGNSEVSFTWMAPVKSSDSRAPSRVYLHINGVHNHHQGTSARMNLESSSRDNIRDSTLTGNNTSTRNNNSGNSAFEVNQNAQAESIWSVKVCVPQNLLASYFVVCLPEEAFCYAPELSTQPVTAWWPKFRQYVVAEGILRMPKAEVTPGWQVEGSKLPSVTSKQIISTIAAENIPSMGTADLDISRKSLTSKQSWREWKWPGNSEYAGRRIWLSYPPNSEFDASVAEPILLILFDGNAWVERTSLPVVIENLTLGGTLPLVYVAAIDPIDLATRNQDLVGNENSSDSSFARLVATDILPAIREEFGMRFPADRVVVAGHSFGGTSALNLVLCYPEYCANAISNSGSVFYPEFLGERGGEILIDYRTPARLHKAKQYGAKFYLEAGLYERNMALNTEKVVQAIVQAKLNVGFSALGHCHEITAWRGGLIRGLFWLFGL